MPFNHQNKTNWVLWVDQMSRKTLFSLNSALIIDKYTLRLIEIWVNLIKDNQII